MGLSYANLYANYVEKHVYEQYTGHTLDFFVKFIDDCFATSSSSREDLERFISFVDNFHAALKFTWEISKTSVSFLDILVSINGNVLKTSEPYKPTDSNRYLLFSSSLPNHTKKSIHHSQILRFRHLCSDDRDFETKFLEMRSFFVQRDYPSNLLDTAIQKAYNVPVRTL